MEIVSAAGFNQGGSEFTWPEQLSDANALEATAPAPSTSASSEEASARKQRIISLHVRLISHVHSPLCNRRERVCTAVGRFREGERLALSGRLEDGTLVTPLVPGACIWERALPRPSDNDISVDKEGLEKELNATSKLPNIKDLVLHERWNESHSYKKPPTPQATVEVTRRELLTSLIANSNGIRGEAKGERERMVPLKGYRQDADSEKRGALYDNLEWEEIMVKRGTPDELQGCYTITPEDAGYLVRAALCAPFATETTTSAANSHDVNSVGMKSVECKQQIKRKGHVGGSGDKRGILTPSSSSSSSCSSSSPFSSSSSSSSSISSSSSSSTVSTAISLPQTVSNVVGPCESGPPKALSLVIKGECRVGGVLKAAMEYWGGFQGKSIFWWIRIRKGKRETITRPRTICRHFSCRDKRIKNAAADDDDDDDDDDDNDDIDDDNNNNNNNNNNIYNNNHDDNNYKCKDDPRWLHLCEEDEGCTFKVKCRPVRDDGKEGEIQTSKASAICLPKEVPI